MQSDGLNSHEIVAFWVAAKRRGKQMLLQYILIGCLMAVLYSLLSGANVPPAMTALTMGGAFIAAIIYGLITEG
jgi:hypothetical protein